MWGEGGMCARVCVFSVSFMIPFIMCVLLCNILQGIYYFFPLILLFFYFFFRCYVLQERRKEEKETKRNAFHGSVKIESLINLKIQSSRGLKKVH